MVLGNTLNVCTARKRGRPKELSTAERETAILDAAEILLAKSGLKGASMAAIAKAAGMSKRTVYEVFPCRAALFEACIRRIRLSFVKPLDDETRKRPLRERLLALFDPETRVANIAGPKAVLRAVVVEAHAHPDLGQIFLREGPNISRAIVRDELVRAQQAGEITLPDPDLSAMMLCDMVFENPIDHLVDVDRPPLNEETAKQRLNVALDIFLNGCRSGTASA
ncbi:TetR/AcrR family transcriptional regulator [Hwanghaeella grinnelliae]|uniref:TetR/AcrR family transcriptional regulator n=1 Tax=Hwanghaeella grinnelliae TaxID=2500179 RepID=A0A437QMR5_9PROT|nr:TetR/AcrR family transcriptional regulator [Hwanghaeella grinnelliae]RVU35826.1 TetR/AcrR family transcriptional regulator [Hwanghaeella grinnelliae]